jgi:hypothetical protein
MLPGTEFVQDISCPAQKILPDLMKSENHEAPHCALFFLLLPLHPALKKGEAIPLTGRGGP